jgi:hypothetical protein
MERGILQRWPRCWTTSTTWPVNSAPITCPSAPTSPTPRATRPRKTRSPLPAPRPRETPIAMAWRRPHPLAGRTSQGPSKPRLDQPASTHRRPCPARLPRRRDPQDPRSKHAPRREGYAEVGELKGGPSVASSGEFIECVSRLLAKRAVPAGPVVVRPGLGAFFVATHCSAWVILASHPSLAGPFLTA